MPAPARAPRRARARRPRAAPAVRVASAICARGAARGHRSRSDESLAVQELAAREPPEGAALDDLHVRGRGVVLGMLLAVRRQPGANVLLRAHARHTLTVDEEGVVGHQPPAVAYAGAPASASAACAAARRA